MIKELKAYIDAKIQAVLKTGIKERSFASIDNVDYDTKTLTVSSWSDGVLQKILLTAKKEIGIREILGIKHNKRILEYHQATSLKASEDEVSWCASFANFILKQCGISGTYSAMARSFLNFGQSIFKNPTFSEMKMRNLNELLEWKLVVKNDKKENSFYVKGLNKRTLNDYGIVKDTDETITTAALQKILTIHAYNQFINTQEQLRLFFGDIAFYKDATDFHKRITSAKSTRTLVANDSDTIDYLNDNLPKLFNIVSILINLRLILSGIQVICMMVKR